MSTSLEHHRSVHVSDAPEGVASEFALSPEINAHAAALSRALWTALHDRAMECLRTIATEKAVQYIDETMRAHTPAARRALAAARRRKLDDRIALATLRSVTDPVSVSNPLLNLNIAEVRKVCAARGVKPSPDATRTEMIMMLSQAPVQRPAVAAKKLRSVLKPRTNKARPVFSRYAAAIPETVHIRRIGSGAFAGEIEGVMFAFHETTHIVYGVVDGDVCRELRLDELKILARNRVQYQMPSHVELPVGDIEAFVELDDGDSDDDEE